MKEIVLISVSFLTVGSKQNHKKMDRKNAMVSSYHHKSDLLKTWECHFYLVWTIEFNIVLYLRAGVKAKFPQITLTWQIQLTFIVCVKTVNELYVFLMGFIICFKKRYCCSTMFYLKNAIYSWIKVSQILYCAKVPVAPTKKWFKVDLFI